MGAGMWGRRVGAWLLGLLLLLVVVPGNVSLFSHRLPYCHSTARRAFRHLPCFCISHVWSSAATNLNS